MGRAVPNASFGAMPYAGDGWHLVAEGAAVRLPQTPSAFALGNGFIGIRGPGGRNMGKADDKVYLNGVFEKMPIVYHEAAHGYARESDTRLAVADASAVRVGIDGAALGPPDRLELDMARGVLVEIFDAQGGTVRIERLVAMARKGVVALRVTVEAGTAARRVSVRLPVTPPPGGDPAHDSDAPYDPRVGPAFAASPWEQVRQIDEADLAGRVDRLRRSGFAVAALAAGGAEDFIVEAGQSARFDCFVAYAAERGQDAPDLALAASRAELHAARDAGFDRLAMEQADWFATFWADAFIAFPDLPMAEQVQRHALFELVQAVGRDGTTSIGAKGQTGEGYEGHVFWDADSYVLPVFAHVRPDIARSMLRWRIDRLGAARDNARAMGQKRGALYPWRTIEGGECSSFFPAGSAQYHINADIAFALKLYVDATGDRSILAEGGAEMLAETARIWLEIGFHDPVRGGAFVINRVTGPDEYTAIVDNNLYTNMLAAEHLRFAAAVARDMGAGAFLSPEEIDRMEQAADAMFLPFDEARQIYAQDEGFFGKQVWPFAETPESDYPLLIHYHPLAIYRHQVAKQADAVLATVLLRDRFPADMRARMLDVYEGVTVHDSTLSASAFAAAAAGVGDAARAAAYWRTSVLTDLSNLFANSDHGLHMAALAGSWTALAVGFAGMRVTGGELSFAPIQLPEIGPYAFRIRHHGRQVEVSVREAGVRYRLLSGDPLTIHHGGEAVMLAGGCDVEKGFAA